MPKPIDSENVIAWLNAQIEKAQGGWLHDYGFPTNVIAALTDVKRFVKNLPTIEPEALLIPKEVSATDIDKLTEMIKGSVHVGAPGGARKLMQDAPAVNRWIPCNERLPEQEVRVLLFAADEVYVGELTDIKDLFDTDIGFMKNGHVTHWMPIPEPPKEDET